MNLQNQKRLTTFFFAPIHTHIHAAYVHIQETRDQSLVVSVDREMPHYLSYRWIGDCLNSIITIKPQ